MALKLSLEECNWTEKIVDRNVDLVWKFDHSLVLVY